MFQHPCEPLFIELFLAFLLRVCFDSAGISTHSHPFYRLLHITASAFCSSALQRCSNWIFPRLPPPAPPINAFSQSASASAFTNFISLFVVLINSSSVALQLHTKHRSPSTHTKQLTQIHKPTSPSFSLSSSSLSIISFSHSELFTRSRSTQFTTTPLLIPCHTSPRVL